MPTTQYEKAPVRSITFVYGHDENGYMAKQPITNFIQSDTGITGLNGIMVVRNPTTNAVEVSIDQATTAKINKSSTEVDKLKALAFKDKASVDDIQAAGLRNTTTFLRGDGEFAVPPGAGDMKGSVYDPNNKSADAFNMENMSESTSKLILTPTERANIQSNTSERHSHPNITVLNRITEPFTTELKQRYDIVSTLKDLAFKVKATFGDLDIPGVKDATTYLRGDGQFVVPPFNMSTSVYDPQNLRSDAFARANHTGTQAMSTVAGLENALDNLAPSNHTHPNATQDEAGFMSPADKRKLNDIQAGATKNETDAFLRSRANHTGTQNKNTIVGLEADLAERPVGPETSSVQGIAEFADATGKVIRSSTYTVAGLRSRSSHTGTQPVSTITGLGDLAVLNTVDHTKVDGLGALATKDSLSIDEITGAGALASKNKVDAATDVEGLGALALLDAVSASEVSGLGALATKNSLAIGEITGAGALASKDKITTDDMTAIGERNDKTFLRGDNVFAVPPLIPGSGDMSMAIYDVHARQLNVYDMDSMLESSTKKILTSAERADIVANKAARHTHANMSILEATTASFTAPQATRIADMKALAFKDKAALTDVVGLGALASKDSVNIDEVVGAGTFAKRNSIAITEVSGAGALASLNRLDVTLIDNLGALGTKDAVTIADITPSGGVKDDTTFLRGDGQFVAIDFSSAMSKSVYDPMNVAKDAFDMDNMRPSATKVIMTANERIEVEQSRVARHTHANKTILDATNASFTTALKTGYDKAATETHTHTNKAILDQITSPFTTAESNKLIGIADGATKNRTDADLLNRNNHTGGQQISTIYNLQSELDKKQNIGDGLYKGGYQRVEGVVGKNNGVPITYVRSSKNESLASVYVLPAVGEPRRNLNISIFDDGPNSMANNTAYATSLLVDFSNLEAGEVPSISFVRPNGSPDKNAKVFFTDEVSEAVKGDVYMVNVQKTGNHRIVTVSKVGDSSPYADYFAAKTFQLVDNVSSGASGNGVFIFVSYRHRAYGGEYSYSTNGVDYVNKRVDPTSFDSNDRICSVDFDKSMNKFVMLGYFKDGYRVAISSDGLTWQMKAKDIVTGNDADQDEEKIVAGNKEIVIKGRTICFRSKDNGETWTPLTPINRYANIIYNEKSKKIFAYDSAYVLTLGVDGWSQVSVPSPTLEAGWTIDKPTTDFGPYLDGYVITMTAKNGGARRFVVCTSADGVTMQPSYMDGYNDALYLRPSGRTGKNLVFFASADQLKFETIVVFPESELVSFNFNQYMGNPNIQSPTPGMLFFPVRPIFGNGLIITANSSTVYYGN